MTKIANTNVSTSELSETEQLHYFIQGKLSVWKMREHIESFFETVFEIIPRPESRMVDALMPSSWRYGFESKSEGIFQSRLVYTEYLRMNDGFENLYTVTRHDSGEYGIVQHFSNPQPSVLDVVRVYESLPQLFAQLREIGYFSDRANELILASTKLKS